MQIAIYARVSTTRQADNDLSIPDQLRQMRQWAERHGHVVVKEYIEPGASATDDKRPVFQDMMNDANLKPALFQAVVVHSLSRFFRDLVMGAMYQKTLTKAGVQLISVTQQTQNDPSGDMQRHIFMLFDEYQSKEIAKHTLRGMQENARQGYFNGSKAPFGYKTTDAGQTGNRGRMKKKLAIEESEAELVREVFELYVHGRNGPRIGMKEIAKLLNAKGFLMRGKLWRVQKIHNILTSSTYVGWHTFNRTDSKSFTVKNEGEWIKTAVPAIIDTETFEKATKLRSAWSPKKCVPSREASPHMLTGLLKCGHCNASMTVTWGKGGQYRYYKCNARISKGNTACPSRNLPMEKIDNLVLDAFRTKIYTPEHIRDVIDELRQQLSKHKNKDGQQRLKKLEADLKETEEARIRLFNAIEKGILELDDQLKERAQQQKQAREALMAEIDSLKRQHQAPLQSLTLQKIKSVSKILTQRLAEPSSYARAYLRATLTEIHVTDQFLKFSGTRKSLADLIASGGQINAVTSVPGSIPEWRPLRPSNQCIRASQEV